MTRSNLIARLALANAMIGIDVGHPEGDQSALVSVDYADTERRVLNLRDLIVESYAECHRFKAGGFQEMSKKNLSEITNRAKVKAARKQRRNQK